jgi:hypothetical protein
MRVVRPVVGVVVVVVPVMRRVGQTDIGEQKYRSRNSKNLTHDSILAHSKIKTFPHA